MDKFYKSISVKEEGNPKAGGKYFTNLGHVTFYLSFNHWMSFSDLNGEKQVYPEWYLLPIESASLPNIYTVLKTIGFQETCDRQSKSLGVDKTILTQALFSTVQRFYEEIFIFNASPFIPPVSESDQEDKEFEAWLKDRGWRKTLRYAQSVGEGECNYEDKHNLRDMFKFEKRHPKL